MLGYPDGRRTPQPQLLPNLNTAPFTQTQKAVLDAKAWAVQNQSPFIHPGLSLFNPPADAETGTITPTQYISYPAVGASKIPVISFTVPRGKIACIQFMAIVHVGGNPPDGSGIVIWRVLRNGGGLRGYASLSAQFGTLANPKRVSIVAYEVDTVMVTVECPATIPNGWPPLGIPPGGANPGPTAGSSTAASFDFFMYPISEATMPKQGNY